MGPTVCQSQRFSVRLQEKNLTLPATGHFHGSALVSGGPSCDQRCQHSQHQHQHCRHDLSASMGFNEPPQSQPCIFPTAWESLAVLRIYSLIAAVLTAFGWHPVGFEADPLVHWAHWTASPPSSAPAVCLRVVYQSCKNLMKPRRPCGSAHAHGQESSLK
jgi:hypothetical protein